MTDASESSSAPQGTASDPPTFVPSPSARGEFSKAADAGSAIEEEKKMLDIKLPHIHAPHDENFSWRGILTHIAVVAIGLLLALGLEQGVEYVHHEVQRATLETQMRETFESNLGRAENNIRILNDFRTYLIELRTAVESRMGGGSALPPNSMDRRAVAFAPAPNLGAYQAAKINGSVSLLSLNRIRIYDRIEFQHNLMLRTFFAFFDSLQELSGFGFRFNASTNGERLRIPQPNIGNLSPAQLVEYQAILNRAIQNTRVYEIQMENSKLSYELMLRGTDDADALTYELAKPTRAGVGGPGR